MPNSILESAKWFVKDFLRKLKPLPEGPEGYFVYHGDFGIPFAENGKVKACWIQAWDRPENEGGGHYPGYWIVVGTKKKVNLDGTIVELNEVEQMQQFKAEI